jgi:hypothetical protein
MNVLFVCGSVLLNASPPFIKVSESHPNGSGLVTLLMLSPARHAYPENLRASALVYPLDLP